MNYQRNEISYCVNSKGYKIPPYASNYTQPKQRNLFQRIVKLIFG